MVYHPPANMPSKSGHIQSVFAGWPDLVFVRGGDLFFAELKREIGKTTPEQDKWIAELRKTGHDVYVWRPSDDFQMKERLRKK
jgi:hypothetical protein